MQYMFFYILKYFCNTALLLFFMLKFHCGWKPDCKFEDRRPNEDVSNSAAMESNAGV